MAAPDPIPIIILNWNGLADTRECIASLEQQTRQDFMIWLVDNGSDAAERAKLRGLYDQHPKVRLVWHAENLGFTRGNNAVLRTVLDLHPDIPYVVLLNNDTKASPEWLEELIRQAQSVQAEMVASKMVNYFEPNRMDNAGHQLLNTLEVLPLGHDEPVENFREYTENVGPCAGAGLYSAAMLRKIGLFDEHFENGYEDVELGLRGVVCGYRSVYAPKAFVYHKISRSINRIRDFEYTLNIQRNIYYVIAKLIPAGALAVCFPFLLFRTLAALLINFFFFRWKFLRIQYLAIFWVLTTGRKRLMQARRSFFAGHDTISSIRLIRKMDFFFKKDLQRFYKYLIRGEKMVFEKYD